MTNPLPSGHQLSAQLIAAGWVQGAVFDAPGNVLSWNEAGEGSPPIATRRVRARERLVVATQTCDIKASLEIEPRIEALLCKVEKKPERLAAWSRNSARFFVIDWQSGLVALATYRVIFSKEAMLGLQPHGWPGSEARLRRFASWLGRRFDRPALPDVVVEELQRPIERALEAVAASRPELIIAFSQAVYEIRLQTPETDRVPLKIPLIFMIDEEALTERQADAIEAVEYAIRKEVNELKARLTSITRYTDDQMSVAAFRATEPLFLEYMSFEGDEIIGSLPSQIR